MRRRMLLALAAASVWPVGPASGQKEESKELAPYFPSPRLVVTRMLELTELKAGEQMFDLGSGDGRILMIAAQKFKAKATGVELNAALVERSRRTIAKAGLDKLVNVIEGDFTKQDYTGADVVTLYLLPEANAILQPILEKQLKQGARVVAHDFPVPGWKEKQLVTIPDDGEGRSHTIYLYVR